MDYFFDGIRKYIEFEGVATRKQFWMFYFVSILLGIPFIITGAIFQDYLLHDLYICFLVIPTISIGIRRLHDIGRSGWWQLVMFVPFIGLCILLIFYLTESKTQVKNSD